MAERAGVTFCLENLNTAVDHPGVPFARAADTLALVEAVGHPRVRLMLDLYHAQIGEGNLIELVRRAGPLIGEIQVADVPGRREPAPARSTTRPSPPPWTRWATPAPSAWKPGPPTATATAPWPGSAPRSRPRYTPRPANHDADGVSGAHVQREAASCREIWVDWGSGVTFCAS
jgi:Hydroxypyruvate isomerase